MHRFAEFAALHIFERFTVPVLIGLGAAVAIIYVVITLNLGQWTQLATMQGKIHDARDKQIEKLMKDN